MNEGGEGYVPDFDENEYLEKKVKEANKKFATVWTLEETKERRENWNAYVTSIIVDNKIEAKKVMKKQKEQGWGLSDLKKAINLHNL